MKRSTIVIWFVLLYAQGVSAAVDLIAPLSNPIVGDSVTFVWNSPDGSYCYDNFVVIVDGLGNTIFDSGRFNPNGGDSIATVTGLPNDGSNVTAFVSCNPANTQFVGFTSGAAATGGNGGGGVATGGGITGDVVVTGQVTLAPGQSLDLESGFTAEQREQAVVGLLMTLAVAFGIRQVFKVLR